MNFTEVDHRYEELKLQYQAGTITAEQFDDQLLDMMVRDDTNRWWAKARETGDWHYHDTVTGDWVRADPPGSKPAATPSVEIAAKANVQTPIAATASTSASSKPEPASAVQKPGVQTPSTPAPSIPASSAPAPGVPPSVSTKPTWAAVVPPGAATIQAQPASTLAQPAVTRMAGAQAGAVQTQPAVSRAVGDFGPLPELRGIQKAIFYLLALIIPLVGIILFLVYRHKPNAQDRKTARVFLILGIVSVLLTVLCGGALAFADVMVASTRHF